jgi:PAS domain S-box-containing protein
MGILMVALPLAIQTGVYLKLKHDLGVLHNETRELTTRREIVSRINNMLVMSFYGFQSLMQLKMYGDEEQRRSFKDYVANMLSSCDALADVFEKKGNDPQSARRLKFLVRQFLDSMQKSQFSPEENNQVATIFEGMEANVKFRDSARNLFWQLQEFGRTQEKMVVAASGKEEALRAEFERISDVMVLVDIIVALALVGFFVRNIVTRLNVLKENTRRFGSGIHLLERLDSGDEIGELDGVFHNMVDTLNTMRQHEKKMTDWLEESKERLELVIRNVPAALIVVDQAGFVESLNPTAEVLFDYKSAVCAGRPLEKLFIKNSKLEGGFVEKLLLESAERPLPLEAISSSQEVIPVEVSATSFEGPDGERVLATIIDVTERYKIEQIKRDFYSMVSHDIRTPLTTISGILQLSRLGKYGPVSQELSTRLVTAEDNTHRLLGLVGKLLDLDKLDQGAVDVSREDVAVTSLMEESAKSVMRQSEEKELQLDFSPSNLTVFADRHYLIQVLTNLLANAIKFSPRGGMIKVWAQPVVLPTGKFVQISVADQGPGIPAEKQEEIFERFKQVDSRRDKRTGFGLGLAICKQIIDLHGGEIGLDSQLGKGSIFWCRVQAGSANASSAPAIVSGD